MNLAEEILSIHLFIFCLSSNFCLFFFKANSFVSLTLQRKISQLTNKQTPATTTSTQGAADDKTNQSQDQALKNITNSNILPISMDHERSTNNDGDDFITVDDLDNDALNENNENSVNNYIDYDQVGNNIAGSINSPDISSKLSEYINSNLPQIEKSINNHLANSDSSMSIGNDTRKETARQQTQTPIILNNQLAADPKTSASTNSQFIKTHRKQLSDESFHHVQIFRNNTATIAQNSNNAPNGSSKRSIKKTRVSSYNFFNISLNE
jgi:hypothetical protein